jgi:transposase InsO family protein
LLDIFARVGFPTEMLSDRGSQFTSDMMREVNRLVSVKQLFTTPYNPKCNGLCERMNGVLKAMLKKMCKERPKVWDRYLSAVLFAYREVPQASTGFSPS